MRWPSAFRLTPRTPLMAIAPRSRPGTLPMAIVVLMAIFADHDGHHSRCLGGHHQARSATDGFAN